MSAKAMVGTPIQIGAEYVRNEVMPLIREASKHFSQGEMVQLYAGIISATAGAMEAEFGKAKSAEILTTLADAFKAMPALQPTGSLQ